jgi:hypothetical protein
MYVFGPNKRATRINTYTQTRFLKNLEKKELLGLNELKICNMVTKNGH